MSMKKKDKPSMPAKSLAASLGQGKSKVNSTNEKVKTLTESLKSGGSKGKGTGISMDVKNGGDVKTEMYLAAPKSGGTKAKKTK